MKTSIKTIAAAIALTAFMAGPAAAFVPTGTAIQSVNSVVGSGSNVFTQVNDGTVTLSGYFADAGEKVRALSSLKALDGVEQIIDHTTVSN